MLELLASVTRDNAVSNTFDPVTKVGRRPAYCAGATEPALLTPSR